jgi:Pyridoxamine 5'-phosphate oxidase like
MMIDLDDVEDGHARPMTAQLDGGRSPIWLFTAKDHVLVQRLGHGTRAIATFASKGHDIFATVYGTLSLDNSRATIDKLWTGSSPPGLKAGRMMNGQRSGSTRRAWSPASSCFLAQIPRKTTRTRLPRSHCVKRCTYADALSVIHVFPHLRHNVGHSDSSRESNGFYARWQAA